MHDAVPLGVVEAGQQPLEHAGDLRPVDVSPDERPQRSARRYSIAMYGAPVLLEEVVDGDDVRVGERARDARLRTNRRAADGSERVEQPQLLERDVALEVGLAGEVDDRHPAAADLAHDLVAVDPGERVAGGDRHRGHPIGCFHDPGARHPMSQW